MDPASVLPHRPPFLLVDDLEVTEPGRSARGTWTPGPERYEGHFPGMPILPGVLQVESIAQVGAGGLLADATPADAGDGMLPIFTGLERVRWRRQVKPGDTLVISVELDEMRHGMGKARGRATVDGGLACDATLKFALVEMPS